MIRGMEAHREEHPYVAIEIADGKPQIEYSKRSCQWSSRGDVLRCRIESSEQSSRIPVIEIDGRRLNWREFGELLMVHEGWGLRLMFVPEDEIDRTPPIAVRESREDYLELCRLQKLKPQGSG